MKAKARLLVITCAMVAACSRPKPIELTPQSAQLSSIGPDSVGLSLVLDVHNPNSFDISARGVTATLELQDGSELGRGSSNSAFTIPAEGNLALPAQVDLRWTNLSLLAPYALAAKAVPYRIRGSARIGSDSTNVDVPFTISGQLTPEQALQAGLRGAAALVPKH